MSGDEERYYICLEREGGREGGREGAYAVLSFQSVGLEYDYLYTASH